MCVTGALQGAKTLSFLKPWLHKGIEQHHCSVSPLHKQYFVISLPFSLCSKADVKQRCERSPLKHLVCSAQTIPTTPGSAGFTINGHSLYRVLLKPFLSAQRWDPYETEGITELLVRRDLWRSLVQCSAQSRTVASTWIGQLWLCLAKSWKHPRMEIAQPLWVTRSSIVLLSHWFFFSVVQCKP